MSSFIRIQTPFLLRPKSPTPEARPHLEWLFAGYLCSERYADATEAVAAFIADGPESVVRLTHNELTNALNGLGEEGIQEWLAAHHHPYQPSQEHLSAKSWLRQLKAQLRRALPTPAAA